MVPAFVGRQTPLVAVNPIYQAPILERLKDIEKAVQRGIKFIEFDGQTFPLGPNDEQFEPDAIAIENWVIRPRFREEPKEKT